tara:strand:+ start:421 stop:747 length:327 start_codon:yes stop_codon:yes gene_type:complete
MKPSKLTPYRLPFTILVFFIAYSLLTRTPLFYIPSVTSLLIGDLFTAFDGVKEAEQIALIYAILLCVFAHFATGKYIKIDAQANTKGLLKGIALVVLITAAYIYNIVQ